MNKFAKLILTSSCAPLLLGVTTTASATEASYLCSFTEASYTAPFMKKPSTRACPEGRCSYQVDIRGDRASLNDVSGFAVTQEGTQLTLTRTAKDPVMGGMDTTTFKLNTETMQFENVKTTTPSVVLTTSGSCK